MKKFVLPILASLLMAFMSVSCGPDEVVLESTNCRIKTFTIHNNMWKVDANDDLYCDVEWDAINDDVLKYGNVQAYFYEDVRQEPLPYIYVKEFVDANTGTSSFQPLNIRFDIEQGIITFIVSDVGQLLTDQRDLLTMEFRAVATWPVGYVIEQ